MLIHSCVRMDGGIHIPISVRAFAQGQQSSIPTEITLQTYVLRSALWEPMQTTLLEQECASLPVLHLQIHLETQAPEPVCFTA